MKKIRKRSGNPEVPVEFDAEIDIDLSDLFIEFDPTVIIGAIVTPVGKGDEGSYIRVMAPAWLMITKILRTDPAALFQLTPEQWEQLVAASYEKAGYDEVILTPRSGDFGRDVIASKKGWGCIRIIDQVKAYKPGHLVTANEVRALSGVLHADPRASKGILTTTSDFAPRIRDDPFIAPLCPYRLELVNGSQLLSRLSLLTSKA